jgi:hypothetical protein
LKEKIVGKPKRCFPTFLDGIPYKPIGVDYYTLKHSRELEPQGHLLLTTLRGTGIRKAGSHMPINIGNNKLRQTLGYKQYQAIIIIQSNRETSSQYFGLIPNHVFDFEFIDTETYRLKA